MASIRRSFFANDERPAFLASLLSGCRRVMAEQTAGLAASPDTYHAFCRLLARVKCNFQLSELAVLPDYNEFIRLFKELTVKSLQVGTLFDASTTLSSTAMS
ncbi:unnamed protein product [Protopolystoma xenopodis]|uniref:Uncharacterized protein n=1 Tax=Protopolystoma xenopodis TaxID=117903 RepID=A0A3S5BX58_9PLAT|nr:unnamed protein product [Protopolystoma xenopodis]